ncbi:MAG: class IIb bacteriocin, lactobin A/cerein 7B family [Colwellia sp.]|nr:class IIb bacteriocin, lactobin A/cerein 7B family [Colwellia sp.]
MKELTMNEIEQVNGGLTGLEVVGIVAVVAMILAMFK